MKKLFVISLGGSLIIPGEVDTKFLKGFKKLIQSEIKKGNRFIIFTGGGKLARRYQEALKALDKKSANDLDWIGIYSTRLNARLVQIMFGSQAHQDIVEDPNKKVNFRQKILVAGGWMPGRSTDDDSVRLAKVYGTKTIINLSNIDYLYDKDPNIYKNAKAIKEISWKQYRKIAGNKWSPGSHLPFDPIASKFAQEHKQQVIIADGKNLKNLENIFADKPFKGTEIR